MHSREVFSYPYTPGCEQEMNVLLHTVSGISGEEGLILNQESVCMWYNRYQYRGLEDIIFNCIWLRDVLPVWLPNYTFLE